MVQAATEEEMIPKMRRLFEAARRGKMTFSKKKIQCSDEVEFGGYIINKNEMKALPRKIYSILDFPDPEDETELKRFLGLCGQFRIFSSSPDLSHMGKPFRELLKKGNTFHFGPIERKHFNDIKEAIGGKMALVTYDPL